MPVTVLIRLLSVPLPNISSDLAPSSSWMKSLQNLTLSDLVEESYSSCGVVDLPSLPEEGFKLNRDLERQLHIAVTRPIPFEVFTFLTFSYTA